MEKQNQGTFMESNVSENLNLLTMPREKKLPGTFAISFQMDSQKLFWKSQCSYHREQIENIIQLIKNVHVNIELLDIHANRQM